jgi:hypothetical protein
MEGANSIRHNIVTVAATHAEASRLKDEPHAANIAPTKGNIVTRGKLSVKNVMT